MRRYKSTRRRTKLSCVHVLLRVVFTLAGCVYNPLVCQHAAADERPNFLFIAVDDLNDFAGYAAEEPGNFLQVIYPDVEVRAEVSQRLTPNLDKLARKSAPFVRAYCPSALCGPSRTSLMTGVAPYRSGYYGHSRHFRTYDSLKNAVTLPQQLKSSGYFTTGLGNVRFLQTPGDEFRFHSAICHLGMPLRSVTDRLDG